MKTKSFYNLILSLSFILFAYSCSSSDDSNDDPNNNLAVEIQTIETAAESGTWRITSYIDSGQDETNDFNGYDFTFNANGTVMAVNGATTVNGSWSVTDNNNSSDDSPDSDIDFNLSFAAPEEFMDLTDDWDVITHTSTLLSLIDISGGNGGTDTLIFQKN